MDRKTARMASSSGGIWAGGHQTVGRSPASGWKNPKDARRKRRSRAPTKGTPLWFCLKKALVFTALPISAKENLPPDVAFQPLGPSVSSWSWGRMTVSQVLSGR